MLIFCNSNMLPLATVVHKSHTEKKNLFYYFGCNTHWDCPTMQTVGNNIQPSFIYSTVYKSNLWKSLGERSRNHFRCSKAHIFPFILGNSQLETIQAIEVLHFIQEPKKLLCWIKLRSILSGITSNLSECTLVLPPISHTKNMHTFLLYLKKLLLLRLCIILYLEDYVSSIHSHSSCWYVKKKGASQTLQQT